MLTQPNKERFEAEELRKASLPLDRHKRVFITDTNPFFDTNPP
jgi:hypothetical protein